MHVPILCTIEEHKLFAPSAGKIDPAIDLARGQLNRVVSQAALVFTWADRPIIYNIEKKYAGKWCKIMTQI